MGHTLSEAASMAVKRCVQRKKKAFVRECATELLLILGKCTVEMHWIFTLANNTKIARWLFLPLLQCKCTLRVTTIFSVSYTLYLRKCIIYIYIHTL